MLAHNGEINTVWGNRARMDARASTIPAEYHPLYSPDGSDSTSLDEAVELLARNGRSVSQAVRMLVPPARLEKVSEFMHYHADCVEPWDGPAALTFADGHLIGAALDRNGLRPCRYFITRGGLVVAGSEAGLVDLDPESVLESGRLGPGEMLVVDLKSYEVLNTREILARFDSEVEYETLVSDLALTDAAGWKSGLPAERLLELQRLFGYTREDVRMVLQPMAVDGKDAVWSMGDDTPIAALARSPRADLQLSAPAFCAGDESTDRRTSRGVRRPVAYPARPMAAFARSARAYSGPLAFVALPLARTGGSAARAQPSARSRSADRCP